jgi:response regulator RpfG family c-di-GMP phosphodiesterase
VVISALRSYNDIIVIEENRAGLQKIVEASADLFCAKSLEIFIQGIVQQLSSILGCSQDAAYLTSAVATPQPVYLADSDQLYVFAGNGEYANHEGKPIEDVVDEVKMSSCRKALKERSIVYADDHLVAFCDSKARRSSLLYLSGLPRKLTQVDKNLVEIFAQNVQIAFDNVLSTRDMEDTQQEIIERLGVAMEHNTNTTQQLRRIRDICEFIGTKLGMEEADIALLVRAVPLHDIGSANVPSAILQKPEELEYLERESIKRHTTFGYNILKDSKRPIIQLAATLAHQHHERWDGLGYPNGMKGEEIALEARITAIADVFDALYNQRPHKPAWPVEKVVKMIESQSGKHFDPKIAQILLDNLDQIQAIQERHAGT